jgi:DNA-binding MarR family transcriptional regulator
VTRRPPHTRYAQSAEAKIAYQISGTGPPDLIMVPGLVSHLDIQWEAVDARLRQDHDLPLSRFEPLQVIGRRKTCRVHDIAGDLAITAGGTSKLVDRIEAAGLCRRLPNPEDGRSSLIEITKAGGQLLADATRTAEDELRARIGAELPGPAARDLVATLTALRRANRLAHAAAASAPTPEEPPDPSAQGAV